MAGQWGPPEQGGFAFQPPERPTRITPFEPLDFSTIESGPREPVSWIADGFIPRRGCILFSGATGLGKTYLLEHLMCCCALGLPWLGREVLKCRSLALFCEDELPVLLWRRDRILRELGLHFLDLEGNMRVVARRGMQNALMRFTRDSERGSETTLFNQVRHYTREHGIQLVVVDTSRQTFDGNENSAFQVTEFVNRLNDLAAAIDGAVVVTQHPSKEQGSVFAGSGAWANTVRAHMDLSRVPEYDPKTGMNERGRMLRSLKLNYAGRYDDIRLLWDTEAGMFLREGFAGRQRSGLPRQES